MSDGTQVQVHDMELECRECGRYDEVEVHFDPETGYSWWTCERGHENSRYEDEWEDDDGIEDWEAYE